MTYFYKMHLILKSIKIKLVHQLLLVAGPARLQQLVLLVLPG